MDTNNEGECLLEKAIEDENENLIGYLISNHYMSSEQAQELMAKRQKGMDGEAHDEEDDEEYLLPDSAEQPDEEEMIPDTTDD